MTDNLSVDAAVGLLTDAPEQDAPEAEILQGPEPEESPEGEDIEAQPEAESDDEGEAPAEVENADEPEPETAVEAPHYWSADKKAAFAALPADLQQTLKDEWLSGERITSQKLEEAATARKAAEAETNALKALSERIQSAAERAEGAFADRWAGMTQVEWVKLAQEDPTRYTQLKAQFDAERDAVQQSQAARDAARQIEHTQWLAEQESRLKTLAPELSDPVKGAANRGAVAEYLKSQGVAEQDLPNVGALEVSIAWKAMQYDKGRAALSSSKPPAERAPVRPAASPSQAPQKRSLADAESRFNKTGSIDDAVRLLALKG